jgi:hypothetical protein
VLERKNEIRTWPKIPRMRAHKHSSHRLPISRPSLAAARDSKCATRAETPTLTNTSAVCEKARSANMQYFVGLDVPQQMTQLCSIGSNGKEWDY